MSTFRSCNMAAIRKAGIPLGAEGPHPSALTQISVQASPAEPARFIGHRPAHAQNRCVRPCLFLLSASGVPPHHDTENQRRFLGPKVWQNVERDQR
jgi:hypothetical protein